MEVLLGTKQKDGSTVSILGPDRRKHMAIFGKSGVGKTTLMRNMIVADIEAGNVDTGQRFAIERVPQQMFVARTGDRLRTHA